MLADMELELSTCTCVDSHCLATQREHALYPKKKVHGEGIYLASMSD